MDMTTLAALMLKAKRVFASDKTFLSFPVTPLAFQPRELDFFDQSSGQALAASLAAHRTFARLVNMIPTGEAWQPVGSDFLWDVWQSILGTAELAQSTRTSAEEAAYRAAEAVLHREDGSETPTVQAYNTQRDAYLLAGERYRTAQQTAECSDESTLAAWRATGEPALRAELDAQMRRWVVDGHKDEVEAAQAQLESLGARSPWTTWHGWQLRSMPAIDTKTDADDTEPVYITAYTPRNATVDGAWSPFSLEPAEIEKLLKQAPADWLERLGISPSTDKRGLDFEFSSAGITRSWFDPNLFKARFWRLPEGRQISDGGNPATGECPAYVAGVVFARHVRVRTVGSPAVAQEKFSGFAFEGAEHGMKLNTRPVVKTVTDLRQNEAITKQAMAKLSEQLAAADKKTSTIKAVLAKNKPSATISPQSLVLRSTAIRELPATAPAPAPAAPAPVAAPAAAPPDATIYILAFICKPVGLCPAPDATLSW